MDSEVILEFDYMTKDTVCTNVKVFKGGKVKVEDFVDNIIYKAFGSWGNEASVLDIDNLFESRCFPRTRVNCKELLSDIGLKEYTPRQIIAHTHGVLVDDFHWIRFSDEKDLTWADVSKILGGSR